MVTNASPVGSAIPLTGAKLCFDRTGHRLVAIEADAVVALDLLRSERTRSPIADATALAELPVSVFHANGHIDWVDKTNGSAPATAATWIRSQGGAKAFLEREILNKSLDQHGVLLTTDHQPRDPKGKP